MVALLGPATPAPAQASQTAVVVAGGPLGLTTPAVNDSPVVILDGTARTAHAPIEAFSVTDARGNGRGWTLTAQATPFREWDGEGYVPGGQALPAGSLSWRGFLVSADGTDSQGPVVTPGPYTLDAGPVTLAEARAGTGMGRFTFSPAAALEIAVPAGAYARRYRSELSMTVLSGP